MTSKEENWGIVKGWLIAKDAPESVMQAMDGLREKQECTIRNFTMAAVVVDAEANEPPPVPTPTTPPKKTRNWTPEQRAAAAERIRARMAKKRREPATNPGE